MAATTLSVTAFYALEFYQTTIYITLARIAPIARILSLTQRVLAPRR